MNGFYGSNDSHHLSQSDPTAVPVVVKALIIANLAFFAVGYLLPDAGNWLLQWFALWPLGSPEISRSGGYMYYTPEFHPWQALTYGFLHGGFAHLFFNMYALYLFGSILERVLGPQRFLIYYIVCVLGAAITQLVVSYGSSVPTVGASGGVFGLLLAFGMFFPRTRLQLLLPPVSLEARWLVIIYGALELMLGVTQSSSGIAHFAHLGGMIFGLPLIWYWLREYRKGLHRF